MRLEQIKLSRELRAKTALQWRQNALRDVTTCLKIFKNTFLTAHGGNAMLSADTYTAFKAGLYGTMNDAVSVSANAEAAAGSVTINKITALALGAAAKSLNRVSAGGIQLSDNNYVALGDLQFANSLFGKKSTVSFTINGIKFSFGKTTTLQQMIATINSSTAKVNMTYSRLTDGFTINSKETGAHQTLILQNICGNAFGENSAFDIPEYDEATALRGVNAVAYINGARVERAGNDFRFNGILHTLNYITGAESPTERYTGRLDASYNPNTAINVLLTRDFDSSHDKIQSFIYSYNTLLKKLYVLLAEKKDNRYFPLTQEEKATMTERRIEQWENIAKSGLLRNDRDNQILLNNMRAAFYGTVEGVGLSPQQIGLRNVSYFTGGKGEIVIDEAALRQALERDTGAVKGVFMSGGDSANPAGRGLVYRLSDAIDNYIGNVQSISLDGLDPGMSRLNDKIGQMGKKMRQLEERYYWQYAALEKAMAQMTTQGKRLNSVITGLKDGK
jgi:flagellar hook-associated protein 2